MITQPTICIGEYEVTKTQLEIDINETLQNIGIMEDSVTEGEAIEIANELFKVLKDKYDV